MAATLGGSQTSSDISIDLRKRFDLPPNGEITCTVQHESGQEQKVFIEKTGKGLREIKFFPKFKGKYFIFLFYNGALLDGCPYTHTVS